MEEHVPSTPHAEFTRSYPLRLAPGAGHSFTVGTEKHGSAKRREPTPILRRECDRLSAKVCVGVARDYNDTLLFAKIDVRLPTVTADRLGSFPVWRHPEVLAAIRASESVEEIPERFRHWCEVIPTQVVP